MGIRVTHKRSLTGSIVLMCRGGKRSVRLSRRPFRLWRNAEETIHMIEHMGAVMVNAGRSNSRLLPLRPSGRKC
jgi:hypothetical protein